MTLPYKDHGSKDNYTGLFFFSIGGAVGPRSVSGGSRLENAKGKSGSLPADFGDAPRLNARSQARAIFTKLLAHFGS